MSSRSFVPRLTRGEYWILNSLVERAVPLAFYRGEPQTLWEVHNRQPHGLTEDELVLTLLGLFNAGWVVGEEHGRGPQSTAPFDPTGAAIRRAFDVMPYARRPRTPPSVPWVSLRLTAEGGAVWEAFAEPRWEDFLEDFYDGTPYPENNRTVRATSRERAICYLRCWAEVEPFDPDAITWKPVAPFEATYWKTLPIGFEGRFRYREDDRRPSRAPSRAEFLAAQERQLSASRKAERFCRWRAWE